MSLVIKGPIHQLANPVTELGNRDETPPVLGIANGPLAGMISTKRRP